MRTTLKFFCILSNDTKIATSSEQGTGTNVVDTFGLTRVEYCREPRSKHCEIRTRWQPQHEKLEPMLESSSNPDAKRNAWYYELCNIVFCYFRLLVIYVPNFAVLSQYNIILPQYLHKICIKFSLYLNAIFHNICTIYAHIWHDIVLYLHEFCTALE